MENQYMNSKLLQLQVALQDGHDSEKKELIGTFWEDIKAVGTPLIEPVPGSDTQSYVTFVVDNKEKIYPIAIWSPFTGQDLTKTVFQRFFNTDIYYFTTTADNRLVGEYKIINCPGYDIAEPNTLDPPRAMDNFGDNMATYKRDPNNLFPFPFNASSIRLSDAPTTEFLSPREGVPKGLFKKIRIKSEILGKKRRLWLYVPASYSNQESDYPIIVIFDGYEATSWYSTPTILDNMIHDRVIPPCIAVMIDNRDDREGDLVFSPKFAEFVKSELLPTITQDYNITKDRKKGFVSGASWGGLCAGYFGVHLHDIFGNIIMQSYSVGSKDNTLEKMFKEYSGPKMNIFMEYGSFEGGKPNWIKSAENLENLGHNIRLEEYVGGHDIIRWQSTFSIGLIHLFKQI